ncbi:sulfite exporter TauE/SafE family protein [Azonexus sp.]|uniref:urease accessory protein UreH domain-containing protein n=1 Tax=Azonexus sp. TaxID=1872668 RepID=UPI0027BB1F2B|nr:sulfite exporter TauE/SafE family protein [Azonexus sp.]
MSADSTTSLLTVFLLGVSLGLTACAVTCLPFIGTLAFGKAGGRRAGLIDMGLFLGGRLLAYSMLGGLAGLVGAGFVKWLVGGLGNLIIGSVACLTALLLVVPGRKNRGTCGRPQKLANFPPFLLGIALTLIPCAPLATLLATAAAGASAMQGALLGMVFGLGALLTPMLVLIPACASVGEHLRNDQPWLEELLRFGAAVVLLLIGCRRIATVSPEAALVSLLLCLAAACLLLRRRPGQTPIPVAVVPVVFRQRAD